MATARLFGLPPPTATPTAAARDPTVSRALTDSSAKVGRRFALNLFSIQVPSALQSITAKMKLTGEKETTGQMFFSLFPPIKIKRAVKFSSLSWVLSITPGSWAHWQLWVKMSTSLIASSVSRNIDFASTLSQLPVLSYSLTNST